MKRPVTVNKYKIDFLKVLLNYTVSRGLSVGWIFFKAERKN